MRKELNRIPTDEEVQAEIDKQVKDFEDWLNLWIIVSIVFFFSPVLIFIIVTFEYQDNRPEWSHQMGDVRLGFA